MPVIQLQVSVSITEEVAKSLAAALAPAIQQALEPKPSDEDVRAEVRLRVSRNAIFVWAKTARGSGAIGRFPRSCETTQGVSKNTLADVERWQDAAANKDWIGSQMELRSFEEMGGGGMSI